MSGLNAKRAVLWLTISRALSALGVLILLIACTENPVGLRKTAKLRISSLIPEGWGFFTRDPKEEDVYIYQYAQGRFQYVDYRLNRPVNLFGLRRINPHASLEQAIILQQIKSTEWKKSHGYFDTSITNSRPVIVYNDFPKKTFNGTYLIELRKPVPFEWYSGFKGNMQSKCVVINVKGRNK